MSIFATILQKSKIDKLCFCLPSITRKETIIDVLNKTFIAITTKRGLPQFFKNEIVLEKYTTQKTDVRKGINRMPVEKPAVRTFQHCNI